MRITAFAVLASSASVALAVVVPATPPSTAKTVDKSLVSVSIEFFTFPEYTTISATATCLANLATLRGAPPAVRIGGTTQDRATYDPNLTTGVNYTVASPTDAPASLTYGPVFFTAAAQLAAKEVTLGLNRQLNQQSNSLAAAVKAKATMSNLYAVELGNEPEYYASGSAIIPSTGWSDAADAKSEADWFAAMAPSLGNIFQGGVRLSWTVSSLVSQLSTTTLGYIKSFSRHVYPQSACGGSTTDLTSLMSHSGTVSYTNNYQSEATAVHAQSKKYFIAETNSATCGGGGISPTFGAALWIIDYVLQAATKGVDRLYFHQGTIGNCAYCWWDKTRVQSPYYGAYFASEFLGTDGVTLAALDASTTATAIGTYAVYSSASAPVRLLAYNSAYFTSGTRPSTVVSFSGLGAKTSVRAKRLSAAAATSRADQGALPTIGGGGQFAANCVANGTQVYETVSVVSGVANVTVKASEAVILYL